MIREAERRANAGLGEYAFPEIGLPTDLQQFLDVLQLPQASKQYWTARQAHMHQLAFEAGRAEEQLTPSKVCAECEREENVRDFEASVRRGNWGKAPKRDQLYIDWVRRQDEAEAGQNMWSLPQEYAPELTSDEYAIQWKASASEYAGSQSITW